MSGGTNYPDDVIGSRWIGALRFLPSWAEEYLPFNSSISFAVR
jgi:hypothetical protein